MERGRDTFCEQQERHHKYWETDNRLVSGKREGTGVLLEGAFRGDVFLPPAQLECQTRSFDRNGSSGRIVADPSGRMMADPDITPILRRRPVFFVDNKRVKIYQYQWKFLRLAGLQCHPLRQSFPNRFDSSDTKAFGC